MDNRDRKVKISPSILSADFSKLGEEAEEATRAGADFLHIDVMDGHFVPNISFGATVMKSLTNRDTAPFDVHLMIENPDFYIGEFVTDKTEYITVHQEATKHLDRTIELIKNHGIKAGVSLNPATPVSTLKHVIDKVDLVLVMSVNPGFGGQSFISYTMDKVKELVNLRNERGLNFDIEIDGGVNKNNSSHLAGAGVDILVAGSAVFNSKSSIYDNIKSIMTFYTFLHKL